jgi:membrane protein
MTRDGSGVRFAGIRFALGWPMWRRLYAIGFRRIAKALYTSYFEHDIDGSAAQLSFYLLFAIFPFLFFLTTLAAYLPIDNSADAMLRAVSRVMPAQAMALLSSQVHNLLELPRPRLLTVTAIVALWSASRGLNALRLALNRAYGATEKRSFWLVQGMALAVTIIGSFLLLLSAAALVAGSRSSYWVAAHLGIGPEYHTTVTVLRWPMTALFMLLVTALAYHWLPARRRTFTALTPGAGISTAAWLLVTWGFAAYVAHFATYNVTYGSIGGVIVLLTWFYLTSLIFIFGGEINALAETMNDESGRDTSGRQDRHAVESGKGVVPRDRLRESAGH